MTTFVDLDGFRYTTDCDSVLLASDYPKDHPPPLDQDERRPTSITWTEFSPLSPCDPLHYPLGKKYFISTTACLFTLWTSFNASSYAIGKPPSLVSADDGRAFISFDLVVVRASVGEGSMERDLKTGRTEAAAGLSLYAWGFAVFPMVLAPFSEE